MNRARHICSRYTFIGKEEDRTREHDFGPRYYSADLGRFLAPDPILSGASPYAYAGGNPVMYYDPTGLTDIYVHLSPEENRDAKLLSLWDNNRALQAQMAANRAQDEGMRLKGKEPGLGFWEETRLRYALAEGTENLKTFLGDMVSLSESKQREALAWANHAAEKLYEAAALLQVGEPSYREWIQLTFGDLGTALQTSIEATPEYESTREQGELAGNLTAGVALASGAVGAGPSLALAGRQALLTSYGKFLFGTSSGLFNAHGMSHRLGYSHDRRALWFAFRSIYLDIIYKYANKHWNFFKIIDKQDPRIVK